MNQSENKTNILAILGFIFSFLFSLVGLILSILGLKKSKEINSGKRLSIAGIIISTCEIILSILLIFLFASNYLVYDGESNMIINNHDKLVNNSDIYFSCHLKDYMSDNRIADNDAYGVGDNVVCSFNNSTYNISKLRFNYIDNDIIKLIDISSENNGWKIERNSNTISLTNLNMNSKINDVVLMFNIVGNKDADKKYEIRLNDINFSSLSNNYLSKDIIVELESPNYRIRTTKGKVEFYKLANDGSYVKLNEMNCNCSRYAAQDFTYEDYSNGNIMLADEDNETMILYNIENGILGTYDGNARWLYDEDDEFLKGTYIYIKDRNTDKFVIVDTNGNIVKESSSTGLCDNNIPSAVCLSYSIKDDLLVNKSDNKYGIIRITSDDVVIDYKYDDIKLLNSHYFKVKENDKWYLYSFDTKNKFLSNAFNDIELLTEDILIVGEDGYWKFIYYNGDIALQDKIEIDPQFSYIYIDNNTNNENIVYIRMFDDEFGHEESPLLYEYDIKKKSLKKSNN